MTHKPNEFLDAGEFSGAFWRVKYAFADAYVEKVQDRARRGAIGDDEVLALADLWKRFVDEPRQAAFRLAEANRLITEIQTEEAERRRVTDG